MTCYDLRFPELARRLVDAGAEVIVVPAAWLPGDRKVEHWRTLLAARAIENTCFVVGAAQPEPRYCGHSAVVGPMGEVLGEAGGGEASFEAVLDRDRPRRGPSYQPVPGQPPAVASSVVSSPSSDSPRGSPAASGLRSDRRRGCAGGGRPSRRRRHGAGAGAGRDAAGGPRPCPAPVAAPAPAEPSRAARGPAHGRCCSSGSRCCSLGAAALGASAVTGIVGHEPTVEGYTLPSWIDGAGAVAVVTALSWLLATRTAGRALVSAGLALALGVASLLVGGRVLPTGAAVMTCVVGSVYAVMVTVPAVTWLKAVRETLVATLVAAVTAFAAVGFEPTVAAERFDIAALLLALALVFTIVYRLGAGLHGLGRRGLVIVAIGLAVLVATLAYAELLRRYGAQTFVSSVLDFADATSERIGAFPRPLVVLLGIPALVWGTHVAPAGARAGGCAPSASRRPCRSRRAWWRPTAPTSRPACGWRTPSSWACCSATSSSASTWPSPGPRAVAGAARRRPGRTAPSRAASPSCDRDRPGRSAATCR